METPEAILIRSRELRRVLGGKPSRRAVSLATQLNDVLVDAQHRIIKGREVVKSNPGLSDYLERLIEAHDHGIQTIGTFMGEYDTETVARAIFDGEDL